MLEILNNFIRTIIKISKVIEELVQMATENIFSIIEGTKVEQDKLIVCQELLQSKDTCIRYKYSFVFI